MTPQEASALLAYARQHDHLVLNTDAATDTWAASLSHIPIDAGKVIIQDYYGKHRTPENRKPMDASILRQIFTTKAREYESKQRALEPTPPKRRGGPPPHVKAKIDAFYERVGHKPGRAA